MLGEPSPALSALDLDNILADTAESANSTLLDGQNRLDAFRDAYSKEFGGDLTTDAAARVLLWAVFTEILILYYLGLKSSVIVELYATLEHYARRDLPELLALTSEGRNVATRLIDRRSLGDFAEMLKSLNVWTIDDCQVVDRLIALRNGIAHNNEVKLSRALGQQPGRHINDTRNALSNVNVVPFLMFSIAALMKLTKSSSDLLRSRTNGLGSTAAADTGS